MSNEFRLLLTGENTGFYNMGLDESILKHVSEGKSPPTIRFYSWKPSCVSIGYFQSMQEEVDISKCDELGVEYLRRISGGGAVFHDSEITYSIIAPENHFLIPKDILKSYKIVCNGILSGLLNIGIESQFIPLNDIVTNSKKISGNAQTRKHHVFLQHGTILTGLDVEKMFSLLKVSNEKIRDKMIKHVKERVTSISNELGRQVNYDEVIEALVKGFKDGLNISLKQGEPTQSELELAKKIAETKYSAKEWNFKR